MWDFIIEPEKLILIFKGLMIFAFVGSIFVFLAPDVYVKVNRVLMKEFGFKKKFIPWLETEKKTIDVWVLKRRAIFGVLFVSISFLLMISVR